MKLACNYSTELILLMKRDLAPVDYIKAGAFGQYLPELDAMRELRPVLLHGMGNHERAGMPDYSSLDFSRMNHLLRKCGSPHLAIHMGITNADVGEGWTEDDMFFRMAACANHFKEYLDVPLLLENVGDTPEERTVFDLIPFAEPGQINRLLQDTGAGFLLDIAHAKVTAQYRGWDLRAYLMELPLHLCREMHISGTAFDAAGNPYDAHGPMEDADFATLEWALERSLPDIITLEYGYPAGFAGPAVDIVILENELKLLRRIAGG